MSAKTILTTPRTIIAMRRRAKHVLAFVAGLLLALLPRGVARACAACACGDSTLTASGIERPYINRIRLTLDNRYGSLRSGDGSSEETVHFIRNALALSWAPTSWMTLAVYLPWVTDFIQRGHRETQILSGLGDLELSVRGLVYRDRNFAPRHLLSLTAGLKFPTGPRAFDDSGYPFPDDFQPGSGSWDPFFGVTYTYFSGSLVSFVGSSSFRYATSGPRGYQRGMNLGTTLAVQLQPWGWGGVCDWHRCGVERRR